MKQSVAALLVETYSIDARPGGKAECPFCHHGTFSVKRDDSLGKCFHPACGRYLTIAQCKSRAGNVLSVVLEQVFADFHKALLDLEKVDGRNAYRYCVEERLIHPRVITDSMVGVVPPNYDIAVRFARYVEEAQAAVKNKTVSENKPGRSEGDTEAAAEQQLAFLEEAREKLAVCTQDHSGWLAFFYTNAVHDIVAIRFREPYSRRIVYFKPFKKVAGLFGHGLFSPYEFDELKSLNDLLIVTEG